MAHGVQKRVATMSGAQQRQRSSSRLPSSFFFLFAMATTAPSRAQPASAEALAEAKQRETQARTLLAEGAYEEAAIELRKAYELAPNYKVLYNLGQANIALGRPVEAVEALSRYLEQGGARIERARRRDVEAELERQRARIAELTLTLAPASASVELDGIRVSSDALRGPIQVALGSHRVAVSAAGYLPEEHTVSLAGRESASLQIQLDRVPVRESAPAAQLSITCTLPDVDVFVDRELRGKTPLPAPLLLSAGVRAVAFSRPGYTTHEESPYLSAGAAETLNCGVRPLQPLPRSVAGRLVVAVNESDVEVTVDGSPFVSGSALAFGRHRVEVAKAGFRPFQREVVVTRDATTTVDARLVPQPSFAEAYRDRARFWRYVSYATAATGVVLGAVGVGIYLDDNARFERWKERQRSIDEDWANSAGTPAAGSVDARQDQNDRFVSGILRRDSTALGLGIAGGILVGASAVLFFAGDDPDRYSGVVLGFSPGELEAQWRARW
jgi:hypothetical protein